MLMLLFNLGDGQYAIPVSEVVEVTPNVILEQIARAPNYISGLFNYRGQHVPVIDLCQLILQQTCADNFTSRIILVGDQRCCRCSCRLCKISQATDQERRGPL